MQKKQFQAPTTWLPQDWEEQPTVPQQVIPKDDPEKKQQQRSPTRRRWGHRVPQLSQMTMVECGAACLAMVLSYYGRKTSVSEVSTHCEIGRDGLSALSIVKAARSYGLRVRAISLPQNDLRY